MLSDALQECPIPHAKVSEQVHNLLLKYNNNSEAFLPAF